MNLFKIFKSDEEQAVAAWINYLNSVRLNSAQAFLEEGMKKQNLNLRNALSELSISFNIIENEIIGHNRGGAKGMHGFIAEVAECGVTNAREIIKGKASTCIWINDNGPTDIERAGEMIQQKFVNSGNHFSLQAIQKHLDKYPQYLKMHGKYQIPKDHYEKIKYYLSISEDEANKMPTSTGEFSLKKWKEVNDFFEKGNISIDQIEPSKLEYRAVQANTIEDTIKEEKQSIRKEDKSIKKGITEEAKELEKPKLAEGAKATVGSAVVEGASEFVLEIYKKKKDGKKLTDFDNKDWEDVAKKAGIGTVKGGIRGASIYSLTNFANTPAAAASALCTATFGIANQAYLFSKGSLTEEEFIMNSEMICLDASVSALSSCIGQILIPIPVIGAVIGNTVGTMMYQIAKDNLNEKEQRLIDSYLNELDELDERLEAEYRDFVYGLMEELKVYFGILTKAFSLNSIEALDGSIELARFYGVAEEDILKNVEEIDAYFTE